MSSVLQMKRKKVKFSYTFRFNERVFLVAGCVYIRFEHVDSKVIFADCIFLQNTAQFGGVFYIAHTTGELYLSNSSFILNKTPLVSNFGGGALAMRGFISSFIYSEKNKFIFNKAFHG